MVIPKYLVNSKIMKICKLLRRSPLRKFAHATYKDFFSAVKLEISLEKIDIFNILTQNIDCGYMLEPLRQGGSKEYPQSMFYNKKNRYSSSSPVLL